MSRIFFAFGHSHNKVISIMKLGCVSTKNTNSMEVAVASAGERETKSLGLCLLMEHKV